MHFFVLKPLNWFFQFSWKEKTCLLSAVSIWDEHFEKRIHIRTQKPFFRVFHRFLRNSLRGPKKCQKTQCNSQYDIFLRNFYTRCSPQIKGTFFLFTKVQKLNSKALKRKNAFSFLNFAHFSRRLRKHYAQ